MADIKKSLKDAGEAVADAAGKAKDWVADKTGLGCGTAKGMADIEPHMSVISSCGCTMGKVDRLEGGAIKLTKNDSPDGMHHFIPTAWVDHVDNHVHLKTDAAVTKREWTADAASAVA